MLQQFYIASSDSYDFGWQDRPEEVKKVLATLPEPFFAQSARELMNSADDKKNGTLYLAYKKKFKKHMPAQKQPRGTCFEAGTEIRMADGSLKNIEDIKVGDIVLSHRNKARKVIETKSRLFTGNMFSIYVEGYEQPLKATDKHLILTRKENCENLVWKEMHEITEDDYLVIPRLQDTENVPYVTLDITHYLKDVRYKISTENGVEKVLLHYAKKNKKINRFIEVNEEFAEFIGLYLAEGSSVVPKDRNYPDRVVLTFNLANERHLAERSVYLLNKLFGVDSYIIEESAHNVIRVRSNCCTLGQFLMSFCGKGSLTKRVPSVFFNSKTSVKIKLLDNWVAGDGSYTKSNTNSVCTSSFGLYKDFYALSVSCDIVPTYYKSKQEKHQNAPANRLFYTQDKQSLALSTKSQTHLDIDIGICLKVKTVNIIEVTSKVVYDIGVEEDHSFIAEGFAVHNCVSRGWSRACDYLQLRKIFKGFNLDFKFVSHSFIYGASRVIGNSLSYQDGSVGAWAAKAVANWGLCTRDEVGDPLAGDDSLAVEWAARGVPQKYKDLAKDNLVKKVSLIRTAEEAKAALVNNFPLSVCSNQGFVTTRDSKGFCRPSGNWNHCYPAGTKITTPYGIINIEDLQLGQEVYSANGKINQITHNFKRDYSGKVYIINAKHAFSFTCTEEHPILVYTENLESIQLKSPIYGNQDIAWKTKKLVWKKAKDIVKGDLVISPKLIDHKYKQQPTYKISKNTKNIPNVLDTKDADISWMFGLFAGDGNIAKNHKVTFTLSNNKQINKLVQIIRNKIGLTPYIYEKQNYSRVTIYSSTLAQYFKESFYNKNKEKVVPSFEINKEAFIEGLKDADGNQTVNHVSIYNTSKELLLGIKHMVIELGYLPKISPRKSYKGCYPNAKQGYYITFGNENRYVEYVDNNVCYPVDEIIVKQDNMEVYNLEVSNDHTYIAEGISTHNCMMWSGYDNELRRFLVEQSWGQEMPNGPLYLDQPDNSFWIDWDVADHMLRQEDSFVLCDLDAWQRSELDFFV